MQSATRQTQASEVVPTELEETEPVTKNQRRSKMFFMVVAGVTIAGCVLVLGLESYTQVSVEGRQSGVGFEWSTLLEKVAQILE